MGDLGEVLGTKYEQWFMVRKIVQPHPMWLSSVTIKSDHLQTKHSTHIIYEVKEKNVKAIYQV